MMNDEHDTTQSAAQYTLEFVFAQLLLCASVTVPSRSCFLMLEIANFKNLVPEN